MRIGLFIAECLYCHFNIGREFLLKPEHKRFFIWKENSENKTFRDFDFRLFDLFFVEHILGGHDKPHEEFFIKMIRIAKDIDATYQHCQQEWTKQYFAESNRRAKLQKEKPDAPIKDLTKKETQSLIGDTVNEILNKEWKLPLCTEEEILRMREMLLKKIVYYDNYLHARKIFNRLTEEERANAEVQVTGETRFAHVLYAIDLCLGKYQSFLTGRHPVAGILSGDDLDTRQPHSFCRYCGKAIKDWGQSERRHCGRQNCKRKYNAERQSELRYKKAERRQLHKSTRR